MQPEIFHPPLTFAHISGCVGSGGAAKSLMRTKVNLRPPVMEKIEAAAVTFAMENKPYLSLLEDKAVMALSQLWLP